jgi:hypothetical protein
MIKMEEVLTELEKMIVLQEYAEKIGLESVMEQRHQIPNKSIVR